MTDEPLTDPARLERLARAIVSDVMLYNPEKVCAGIAQDDLFERMGPELEEARTFFATRVDADAAVKTNAFERALVDVLVYRSRHIRSPIW